MDTFSYDIIVNVIATIIAGFLVYIVNKMFQYAFNKVLWKFKFKKMIEKLNKEIADKLISHIIKFGLPDKIVSDSIISSVERKYRVNKERILNPQIICDELIYAIESNDYISDDKKKLYIANITKYLTDRKDENVEIYTSVEVDENTLLFSGKSVKKMISLLGFSYALLFAIIILSVPTILTEINNSALKSLKIVIANILVLAIIGFVYITIGIIKIRKNDEIVNGENAEEEKDIITENVNTENEDNKETNQSEV